MKKFSPDPAEMNVYSRAVIPHAFAKNPGAVPAVIFDAGHGGIDSGATGPFGKEKDAALDVVLRAKKLLEDSGYEVRWTRTSDVLIPVEKRAEFANHHSNALFVSVDFNKGNSGVASGLKTYCLASSMPSIAIRRRSPIKFVTRNLRGRRSHGRRPPSSASRRSRPLSGRRSTSNPLWPKREK